MSDIRGSVRRDRLDLMDADEVLTQLRSVGNPRNREGMARYGINVESALGVSVTELRKLARRLGRDHRLASGLWKTGVHEARILAALVDEPEKVTPAQMERWARGFDSWDLCDQVCSNLFDRTPFAYEKATEWAGRDEEFVKRAGFALMAALAVHDKEAGDEDLAAFLPIIEREADDERNFVKKAVDWALRQIGKRSRALNLAAITSAESIGTMDSRAARWIARDALRELRSEAVQSRLARPRRFP